ncbi:MAG: SAM-dependent methyltransferase [Myxococcota bacterium]|jgi:SAM-dependent methyltransferase
MLFLLAVALACAATPPTYMGRPIAQTMHWTGAEWLVRATRETEEAPAALIAALALEPGETACDVGAGNGFHAVRLAAANPQGRVLAVDIQPEMLRLLQERAVAAGVSNVEPVLGAQAGTNLPDGACDVVLLVDVYHELSDPEAMHRDLRRATRPGGRVAVVEFRQEDPSVPIKRLHTMTKAQVHREWSANGWTLVRQVDTLPWQHVMLYQPAGGPDPAVALTPWTPAPAGRP